MYNDTAIQVRCSRTTLATIWMFVREQPEARSVQSYPKLVKHIIEAFEDLLLSNNVTTRVEDPGLATRLFEQDGFGTPNQGGRAKAGYMRNLQTHSLENEGWTDKDVSDMLKEKARTKDAMMKEEIMKGIVTVEVMKGDRDGE